MFKSTDSYIPGYHWVQVEEGIHYLCEDKENPSLSSFAYVTYSEPTSCVLDEMKRSVEFDLLDKGVIKLFDSTKAEIQMKLILDGLEGGYEGPDHEKADKVLCDTLRYLGYNDLIDTYEKIYKWYE